MKRFALSLLLFALAALACPGEVQEPRGVEFSIRLYDKRVYYLGDVEHPLRFEAVLANDSSETYRFKIADNKLFNLGFEVTTPTNVPVGHSPEFIRSRTANQQVFYREVSLEPGEKYAIVVSLQDFVHIPAPGLYAVTALFFPELDREGAPRDQAVLRSNLLSVNIRPAVVFAEERMRIEAATGELLRRQALPPDEVVAYTLRARQQSQWEKFFLYLHLESLYQREPRRAERYRRMSEENRRAELGRYREQLRESRVDGDIVVVPTSFDVTKTTYTPAEAQVIVIQRFRQADYTELKRYTYSLVRQDDIWMITGYEVLNLGTE